MTTHLPGKLALKAAVALFAFGIVADGADAASIVQTANFLVLPRTPPEFDPYLQFDPALGTLTEVDFGVSGSAGEGSAIFTNTSDQTVSFEVHVSFTLATDAGGALFLTAFTTTLDPGEQTELGAAGPFDVGQAPTLGTLSPWIGTGILFPFDFAFGGSGFEASASDPAIAVEILDTGLGYRGSETITYIFNPVPEPASLNMMGPAVLVMAGVVLRARTAHRFQSQSRQSASRTTANLSAS